MASPNEYEILDSLPQHLVISSDPTCTLIDGEAFSIEANGQKIHLTHAQAAALREALQYLP